MTNMKKVMVGTAATVAMAGLIIGSYETYEAGVPRETVAVKDINTPAKAEKPVVNVVVQPYQKQTSKRTNTQLVAKRLAEKTKAKSKVITKKHVTKPAVKKVVKKVAVKKVKKPVVKAVAHPFVHTPVNPVEKTVVKPITKHVTKTTRNQVVKPVAVKVVVKPLIHPAAKPTNTTPVSAPTTVQAEEVQKKVAPVQQPQPTLSMQMQTQRPVAATVDPKDETQTPVEATTPSTETTAPEGTVVTQADKIGTHHLHFNKTLNNLLKDTSVDEAKTILEKYHVKVVIEEKASDKIKKGNVSFAKFEHKHHHVTDKTVILTVSTGVAKD
jgi:hypothetical protein